MATMKTQNNVLRLLKGRTQHNAAHLSHSKRNVITRNRKFHFASNQYKRAFQKVPKKPDTTILRTKTLRYLDEKFDADLWYQSPVCSIVNGQKLFSESSSHDRVVTTKNAFAVPNGIQHLANSQQVQLVKDHISKYKSPYQDLRKEIRHVEQKLLTEYAPFLIANQCIDFQKQDGITEMEESIMANQVERELNDQLLDDEGIGKLHIDRKPIYISCVSNFSNFLDLFRKTIRSLEVGIPCIILGRCSNSVQHSFRWAELLDKLLQKEDVDPGMLTYISCSLEDIQEITTSCKDHTGNLYATCSRDLAERIKFGYPKTVASTGGPNTLLTTEWTDAVQDSIRLSATIENSGQCTALRCCIVPKDVKNEDVEKVFDSVMLKKNAVDALRSGDFACIFDSDEKGEKNTKLTNLEGYKKHRIHNVHYRLGPQLPSEGTEEHWRNVVIDVATTAPTPLVEIDQGAKNKNLDEIATWLNTNQPITLAVNAPRSQCLQLGRSLFEKTGLVVYTIGSTDTESAPPALSCQARPQEAECFGEFPPRKSLGQYTKYPVVVPSSNPSYNSTYDLSYLSQLSLHDLKKNVDVDETTQKLLSVVKKPHIFGFCIELINYIQDALETNPTKGFGTERTTLWGIQRPPMIDGLVTCIRVDTEVCDLLPILLPFVMTNARGQVQLSLDKDQVVQGDIQVILEETEVDITIENDEDFDERTRKDEDRFWNIVKVTSMADEFSNGNMPMVGQFVSLLFPLGHIKSTKADDIDFVNCLTKSEKWLKLYKK